MSHPAPFKTGLKNMRIRQVLPLLTLLLLALALAGPAQSQDEGSEKESLVLDDYDEYSAKQ